MTILELIGAIIITIVFAGIIAYLFQDCFNRLKDIHEEEKNELHIIDLDVEDFPEEFDSDTQPEEIEYIHVEDQTLKLGCYVYDKLTGAIGIFISMELGEDNDDYAQVLTIVGNTVYVYKCIPKSLEVVEQA